MSGPNQGGAGGGGGRGGGRDEHILIKKVCMLHKYFLKYYMPLCPVIVSIPCTFFRVIGTIKVMLETPAPLDCPVELVEVPRELDWKFADNQPPPSEARRHYVLLDKV